jgi:hypothetical protein
MVRLFGPPDVILESDEQNRGTPYRTCSIAVYVNEVSVKQMDRIRVALSKIVSSPEVSLLATGKPTPLDKRTFVRLRMVYYGQKLDVDEVMNAVKSAF